jgi:hypothetical protein
MAMHRTSGSINRSHCFRNVNGNIFTPKGPDFRFELLPLNDEKILTFDGLQTLSLFAVRLVWKHHTML